MGQRVSNHLAVIGMSGRFPGARSTGELWDNVTRGIESITFFSEDELRGVVPDGELSAPEYVRAKGYLAGWDEFDPGFFGYSENEAALMDPHSRLLHGCLWEALEDAGYAPDSGLGRVGLYVGGSVSPYWFCAAQGRRATPAEQYHGVILNENHALSTRLSYRFGLRGPAVTLQTACSSSLVAVHVACQALIAGECDMAVAGGVSITFPVKAGYLYEKGTVSSPDGHCCAFDASGQGTLAGDGCGLVVLKPLQRARDEGDHIYSVVRGTAINNDGRDKIGYTAPSVSGQADVIRRAHGAACIEPDTINYLEAHGTATPLGDPIEIQALTQAFGTTRRQFCAIGSIKTNLGHLNHAAGIAGFIKAALAVRDGVLPPSLHYREANEHIDFAATPFYVNTSLRPWNGVGPRRAGVSSFGIGGTNAHAVLEQAPEPSPSATSNRLHLLLLSARDARGLQDMTDRWREHLEQHADIDMAAVAFTSQVSRGGMRYRRAVACESRREAIEALRRQYHSPSVSSERAVAYLVPGQGSQHARMGAGLYERLPEFRAAVDKCVALLAPTLRANVQAVLGLREAPDEERLPIDETRVVQPALFVCQYASAALLGRLGFEPVALLGHSLGEFVAACLAGVFSLEDALTLVVRRGELMQALPRGAMLGVASSAADIQPLLPEGAYVAAVNGPHRAVISGTDAAIRQTEALLGDHGIGSRRVAASHAFHSPMMDPVATAFECAVAAVERKPPKVPFLSNVTGQWIPDSEAVSASYWGRQLRETARFADCLEALYRKSDLTLVELGPSQILGALARSHPARRETHRVVSLMRKGNDGDHDEKHLLRALGELWTSGAAVSWDGLDRGAGRRVSLPTYPFERHRLSDITTDVSGDARDPRTPSSATAGAWFYTPVWRRAPARHEEPRAGHLLLFTRPASAGEIGESFRREDREVVTVVPGDDFQVVGQDAYTLRPSEREDYVRLIQALRQRARVPSCVVHAWSLAAPDSGSAEHDELRAAQSLGLYSLLWLTQVLETDSMASDVRLCVVTRDAVDAPGTPVIVPSQSPVAGLCPVITQESAYVRCIHTDVRSVDLRERGEVPVLRRVVEDLLCAVPTPLVAWRAGERWVADVAPMTPDALADVPVTRGGVYVITGGFGHLGTLLAERLVHAANARLVLVGRTSPDAHATSMASRRLARLEADGADVIRVAADCADVDALRAALGHARARWGRIDGLFHAAASTKSPSIRTSIANLTQQDLDEQFHAKARGLLAIRDALQDEHVDFVVVMSSLAAVLGGFGLGAYAAANRFVDACVESWSRTASTRWLSIDWDGWEPPEDGTAVRSGSKLPLFTPERGLDACARVINLGGSSRVIVAATELTARHRALATLAARPCDRRHETAIAVGADQSLVAVLSEIWKDFFGASRVVPDDSFFDLGGDSLAAVALVSRMNAVLSSRLEVSDVLEAPRLADVAQRVEDKRRSAPSPRLVRAASRDSWPLSFAQEAILSLRNLVYDMRVNVSVGFEIAESIDPARLEQALGELICRHEILRTWFDAERKRQYVADIVECRLPVASCDPSEVKARFLDFIRPFDVGRPPLLRVELLRVADTRSVLLFDVHHAITDAVSLRVMLSELWSIYHGRPLAPIDCHYRDYAVWQNALMQSGAFDAHQQFWSDLAQKYVWTELPRSAHATAPAFGNVIVTVDASERQRLTESCARKQVTVMTLLMTAIGHAVRHYARQDDITLGLHVSRRTDPALERMLGPFVEDAVCRVTFDRVRDFDEAVHRTKAALGAVLDRPYPYEQLNAAAQRRRPTANGDMFTILVNNVPAIGESAGGEVGKPIASPRPEMSKYYVNLRLRERDTLALDAKYRADKYSEAFMQEFLQTVVSSAAQIAA
jgi:acyl transferase domain-containing protein